MNNIGPTDNDFLNYLAWCEATGIAPFGEEPTEEINEEDNEEVEDINILIKKRKDD